MLLHLVIPFNLICNMNHAMKKLNFDLLTPRVKGGGGVCRQNICSHVATFRDSNKLIWYMQHDHVLKKLNVDLLTPRIRGGGLQTKYLLPCCYILWFHLIWYATWTMLWKSWILTYWPHPQGWGREVCRQNICDHSAAFVIPFNFICNMQLTWPWMGALAPD